MASNSRSVAARKANATRAVRREFIEEFGQRAFDALVRIAKQTHGRKVPRGLSRISPTSQAAYHANLTRGTYGEFVVVNPDGTWDDDMNLVNV
jgi:hypothetical protein